MLKLKNILNESDKLIKSYEYIHAKPMIITKEQQKIHEETTQCMYCNCNLVEKNQGDTKRVRVRDHCHLTGQFRATACHKCNTQARLPKKIPIVFHNLKNSYFFDLIYIYALWSELTHFHHIHIKLHFLTCFLLAENF